MSGVFDNLLGPDDGTILDEIDPSAPRGKRGRPKKRPSIMSSRIAEVDGAVGVVTNSVEFKRILELTRRALDLDGIEDATHVFQKPDSTMRLRPIQSAALIDAATMDGLFAPIGVGFGKTLITLLLPTAMYSKKAVLLMPPAVRNQLIREIATIYGPNFELPELTIVAYSELSLAKNATLLDQIKPDLIIADEAHHLRHRSAARTKRFMRYMSDHPECRFAALSGTITNKSIMDYAHLIELALRKSSPLPRGYREVKDWAGALDVKPEYVMRPGALRKLCDEGEETRDGYRRRLVETPGVVATSHKETGSSLLVRRLDVKIPDAIETLLTEVRKQWSIEGNVFEDILTYHRTLKQISCGFYYKWKWPGGVVDYEWLEARSAWHRAVRDKLRRSIRGMDSPLLLANAADRALKNKGEGPRWDCPAWADWKAVKDRDPPPTETIWVDDFLCRDAIRYAKTIDVPVILWYEHRAIGERLGKLSGLPVYGQGTDASPTRESILIASRRVQGTGKNLQHHYGHNIFLELPPNGTEFEQSVGRTHRPGQIHDEVWVDWYGHTDETRLGIAKIVEDAEYKQATQGQPQKILYATRLESETKLGE